MDEVRAFLEIYEKDTSNRPKWSFAHPSAGGHGVQIAIFVMYGKMFGLLIDHFSKHVILIDAERSDHVAENEILPRVRNILIASSEIKGGKTDYESYLFLALSIKEQTGAW